MAAFSSASYSAWYFGVGDEGLLVGLLLGAGGLGLGKGGLGDLGLGGLLLENGLGGLHRYGQVEDGGIQKYDGGVVSGGAIT